MACPRSITRKDRNRLNRCRASNAPRHLFICLATAAEIPHGGNMAYYQTAGDFVQHLHDFVRDVELTFEEWTVAIDFLTRTGQICSEKRQEFILLSDTLGVSMLVDAINHRMPEGATQMTVLGPFYVNDPPEVVHGSDLSAGIPGEPLFVKGASLPRAAGPLPVRSSTSGTQILKASTMSRRRERWHFAPAFALTRTDVFISGASCRATIRYLTTGRSVRC